MFGLSVGESKFIFDVWEDTINFASRMESSGAASQIHMTEEMVQALAGLYAFDKPQLIDIKGKGPTHQAGSPQKNSRRPVMMLKLGRIAVVAAPALTLAVAAIPSKAEAFSPFGDGYGYGPVVYGSVG